MEALLRALAHPVRLRAIQILLQDGPLRQEELRLRLEALEGTLSKQMKELVTTGLVARSSPKSECRVVLPTETLTALEAIAELDAALAAGRAADAVDTAERLRRLRDNL
jgi:DNA-binding HxlR family transcriptional regulator